MKEFKAYIIISHGKEIEQNTLRAGRDQCIKDFMEWAPFGSWSVAKDFGYRWKKVSVKLTLI